MKNKRKSRNLGFKKGNAVLDIAFMSLVVFIFALISLASFMAQDYINDEIQNDSSIDPAARQLHQDINNKFPQWFDSAFLFVFVGLWITTLIFAYMFDTYPLFFVISLVLLIFVFIFIAAISATFDELVADADFSAAAQEFPKMSFIFVHFYKAMMVVAFSILIVLYGKGSR